MFSLKTGKGFRKVFESFWVVLSLVVGLFLFAVILGFCLVKKVFG